MNTKKEYAAWRTQGSPLQSIALNQYVGVNLVFTPEPGTTANI